MTQTLRESLFFFKNNVAKILLFIGSASLLFVVLIKLFMPLFVKELTVENIQQFAQAINLIFKPVITGGFITLLYSLAHGTDKTVLNCFLAGVMRWPQMLLSNLMTSLMIFAGLMLLIIPGIWVFSRLFLVPYLVMLDNQSPVNAIINSYHMTEGYTFKILNDVAILFLFLIAVVVILSIFQIVHLILLLIVLLLFQGLLQTLCYRHYEILKDKKGDEIAEQE
jgi:hypothetical protein